jgi:hypothetical protein
MKTKKHHNDTKFLDSENFSATIRIYGSGGVTNTAYLEIINNDAETVLSENKTMRGMNAWMKVEEWATATAKEELDKLEGVKESWK